MSANVYWTPVRAGRCAGKGPLRDLLTKAFGRFPEELGEDDLRVLEIAGRFELADEIQELIDAIEKYGRIRLSVEY